MRIVGPGFRRQRSSAPKAARQVALAVTLWSTLAAGQISTDNTLGNATVLQGPNYGIGAELGRLLGSNLFFSFEQFNLAGGETAFFSGPETVSRIISRVTGGSPSSIDGYIGSGIAGADFFFINPAGIVFGPNAYVDVGGSFHFSTAHYLKLGEAGRFDAADPGASTLTSAPPEAFGFLGGQGAIQVQGTALIAATGQDLSLIGGTIDISGGYIAAPAGSMRLAATQSAAEISIAPTGVQSTAPLDGSIRIGDGAYMETYGVDGAAPGSVAVQGGRLTIDRASVNSSNQSDLDAGDVVLSASQSISIGQGGVFAIACNYGMSGCGSGAGASISLSAPSIVLDPVSFVSAYTFGPANGGDILLDAADSISILGLDPDQGMDRGAVEAATFGAGTGGDIRVQTPDLSIVLAGGIQTYSCGDVCFETPLPVAQYGAGGSVFVDAGRVHLTGQSYIDAASYSDGRAGDIQITASQSLILTGTIEPLVPFDQLSNTSISPFVIDAGDGGTLSIQTPLLRIESDAAIISTTSGEGDAGSVLIDADVVEVLGRGQILTGSSAGGDAGQLRILASESVSIIGDGAAVDFNSTLAGEATSSGRGGSIFIDTPQLTLDDAGSISVSAFGEGDAGSIFVDADTILIDGHSQISASNYSGTIASGPSGGDVGQVTLIARASLVVTGSDERDSSGVLLLNFGTGDGGRLTVETSQLVIDAFSLLGASTSQAGSGGSIRVTADTIDLRGGVINSESEGTGNAGSIELTVVDALRLRAGAGILTSTVQADGGDIDLQVGRLLFLDDSQISTTVFGGSGNGGNIRIDPQFVVLNESGIVANAFGGNGGNIDIVADYFLSSVGSLVQASSALGIDGVVNISSPVVDVAGALGQLDTEYLDASRALRHACAAGSQTASNSFIALGRGGFPPAAGGSLFVPLSALLALPRGLDAIAATTRPDRWTSLSCLVSWR